MIIRKGKSFNTQWSPYQTNRPRTTGIFIEQLTVKLRNTLNNTVIFYWITIKAKSKETQISLPITLNLRKQVHQAAVFKAWIMEKKSE